MQDEHYWIWLMLLLWINIQQGQVTRGGIPDVKKFSLLPTVYATLIPTMYTALLSWMALCHFCTSPVTKQTNKCQ